MDLGVKVPKSLRKDFRAAVKADKKDPDAVVTALLRAWLGPDTIASGRRTGTRNLLEELGDMMRLHRTTTALAALLMVGSLGACADYTTTGVPSGEKAANEEVKIEEGHPLEATSWP